MAEQVYDKAQIAPQAGTFAVPGASVPAITILPVTEAPIIELDRATQYPTEDYGTNEKNHAARGYHGVRGGSLPLNGELTYEQAMHLFEMHYAGGVVPSATTVAITSSSVANPTVITTTAPHGLTVGDVVQVIIAGHSGSTPTINGTRLATVTGASTFTIPVNVSVGGTGGTVAIPPFTWVYLLEKGAPTLVPYTVETGSETSQDQWEGVGVLIDELTLGFSDLDAPGAHPWTFQATCKCLNRVAAAVTASLDSTAIETLQGQNSLFKDGPVSTAFASLSEIAATLKAFSITTRRYLTFRAYGGTGDIPTGYGFSAKTVGEVSAKLRITSTTETNIHNIWAAAGSVLGERRWRITTPGSGTKTAHLDMRVGELKVDISDVDGERVYDVSGETASDATLTAQAGWSVLNGIADLTP